MLAAELQPGMDKVERDWGDICRTIGARQGIPDGWLQAHIWRESGGNPRARNIEGTPGYPADDGIGLMQITSPALKGHLTDEELFQPITNITIGARYIADLGRRYGWDFPRVSAAYNAGSVRPSRANPWGMVMTAGHVQSEVAAYNYWLYSRMAQEQQAAADAYAKRFTLLDLRQDDPAITPDQPDTANS